LWDGLHTFKPSEATRHWSPLAAVLGLASLQTALDDESADLSCPST